MPQEQRRLYFQGVNVFNEAFLFLCRKRFPELCREMRGAVLAIGISPLAQVLQAAKLRYSFEWPEWPGLI